MSSNLPERTTGSPFDALRRTDDRGECWSARELMPVCGYGADWRNFADAVARATAACRNAGHDPADHIGAATKMVRIGSKAERSVADFRLTRFGAYLVAMNGDPRKPEIASAQVYFAMKTREAEIAPAFAAQQVPTHPQALRGWAEALERATGAEQQLAIAAPKVAFVDTYVALGDASTFKVVAGQLGVSEPQLRQYLTTRGVIYRRTVDQRWSNSNHRMEPVYQWLARSQYVTWFSPKDQLKAPRMHNGQYRTTLYITPIGKAGIEAMMRRRPILGQGELDVDGGDDV